MSNIKYEITDIAHEKYPFLHRIRALRDVGIEVRAGDLGGFVEGEHNLSQEQEDASWIFGDAIAAGSASVDKDSCLRDEAVACDQAQHGIAVVLVLKDYMLNRTADHGVSAHFPHSLLTVVQIFADVLRTADCDPPVLFGNQPG